MDSEKTFDRESYRRRSEAFFREWFAQHYPDLFERPTFSMGEIMDMAIACFYEGINHASGEVLAMIEDIYGPKG